MAQLKTRMPDGRLWAIEGPPDASQDEIRAAILDLHPEAGQAQAGPAFSPGGAQPPAPAKGFGASRGTRFSWSAPWETLQNFDVGRDVLTPAASYAIQAAGMMDPARFAVKAVQGGAEGIKQGLAENKQGADTLAKMVVPQTPAQALMLVASPAAGPLRQATATSGIPVLSGIMGRKLLGPALARTTVNTVASAAGGAVDPNSTMAQGAKQGFGASVVGEGLGYLGGKIARSLPGAQRSIAGDDLANITSAMNESLRYVPPGAQGQVPSLLERIPGLDPSNPQQIQRFAMRGGGVDMLRRFMDDRMHEVDRRVGPVLIPALDPENRMMPSQAWNVLSSLGRRGYQGSAENPVTRTGQNVDLRRMWQDGMDQLRQAAFDRDKTGIAPGIFDEARRVYSTGMSYMRLLSDPKAWKASGDTSFLDVPQLQRKVYANQGKLASETAEGAVRGGKMQEPGATIFTTAPQPPPTSAGAPSPAGPTPGAPPGVSGLPAREGPQMEYDPSMRTWIAAEPQAFQPTLPATRGGGPPARPGGGPEFNPDMWPWGAMRRPAPSSGTPPGPPSGPETWAPPGGVGEIMYERMPGSDFAGLEQALFRGAGVGAQADKDIISNLGVGTGLGGGVLRFGLRGLGAFPNVGRQYVGQTPRVLPPAVQQGVNYEILKFMQSLRQPPTPQEPGP